MNVSEITTVDQLNNTIKSSNIVVLDFHAQWCGPCKAATPSFLTLASEFPNVKFVKINVDHAEQGILNTFFSSGSTSIPLFVVVSNGKSQSFEGFDPKNTINSIKKLLV